jgi:arylsulfatase A-like enzyme
MLRPNKLVPLAAALLALALSANQPQPAAAADQSNRPNILVILADDLGYADLGFQGCKDIATPNLDALAKRSVRCTSGYVTHPYCSPTRAGLLTGRYQQRFGHEDNPVWRPEDPKQGLPLSQSTLPQVLKTAGYTTACVGKWHLGGHESLHPNRRGFDEYFGLLGGGHRYLPNVNASVEYNIPLDRNGKPEPLTEYLTTVLGREGASTIKRHQHPATSGNPWFLYLAFNAPHTPLQATDELLARVKHIDDETRRRYAALVTGLDDAVGEVLKTLRDSGQEENTLVFFFSDNGGPIDVTHSQNTPLRGAKGSTYEGGIRVPFLVSWPGKLPQGKDYDQPINSLDVFATAAELTGAKVPATHKLEGVNILPYLTGEKTGAPHERLYWRAGGGNRWAIREGNYKLLKMYDEPQQLVDLAADIGEQKDLSAEKPDVVARLKAAYDTWNKDNIPPAFEGGEINRVKKGKVKARG